MTSKPATTESMTGSIRKMRTSGGNPVQYVLPVGENLFAIDQCIDAQLKLTHTGNIYCISCGRQTKKSFLYFKLNLSSTVSPLYGHDSPIAQLFPLL